jgi:hypothetical protein
VSRNEELEKKHHMMDALYRDISEGLESGVKTWDEIIEEIGEEDLPSADKKKLIAALRKKFPQKSIEELPLPQWAVDLGFAGSCEELDTLGEKRKLSPELQARWDAEGEEFAAEEKAGKKKKFNPKTGQRPAHRVSSLAIPRVRLKNYPDYQIDSHGAVYDMAGKLIAPRWRNGKCWVNVYTHDGKRVSRNVYWLLVDAGYVILSEREKAWRSKKTVPTN